jgi:hypothetical protein
MWNLETLQHHPVPVAFDLCCGAQIVKQPFCTAQSTFDALMHRKLAAGSALKTAWRQRISHRHRAGLTGG